MFNQLWVQALDYVITNGQLSAPRGQPVREIIPYTWRIPMRQCVLTVLERKLNYRFMAANAYWILSGSDRLADIVPYNPNIAQFSDDGETFAGAYGPPIVDQLGYVIRKLREDPDTRQAVLSIWRPSPAPSKDLPCTVAMTFILRRGLLDLSVYMRSSDVWLGVPYDVFDFSMIAHYVAGQLNGEIVPGFLYLHSANLHLYGRNEAAARTVLITKLVDASRETPIKLYRHPGALMDYLKALRETKRGDPLRWWEETAP